MTGKFSTDTIDSIVENAASNRFQLKTSLIAGMPYFIGSVFINLSAIISPYLKCEWQMTTFQVALTSSIFFAGEVFGSFYWGKLGDVIGRKYPLTLVSFGTIYFSLLSARSSTLFWFIITRFFVGQCVGAIFVLTMVYGLEFLKSSRRGFFTTLVLIFFSCGTIYANLIAYLAINAYGWRIYTICIAAPLFLLLPLLALLPESIRYLEVCGRASEIVDIVKDMIKDNESASMPKTINLKCQTCNNENKGSYIWMFCNYQMKVLALGIIWMCLPLTYYGFNFLIVYKLQLNSSQETADSSKCSVLSENDLMNVTLISFSTIPFTFICFGIMEKFGRKILMCFCLVTFLIIYAMMLFSLPRFLMKITLFCGLGLSASALQFLFQYTLELFPTFIRSTSLGFCSTVGKCVSILTPFIFQDMIYWSFPAVMALMASLTMASLVMLYFLEETKGVHLV